MRGNHTAAPNIDTGVIDPGAERARDNMAQSPRTCRRCDLCFARIIHTHFGMRISTDRPKAMKAYERRVRPDAEGQILRGDGSGIARPLMIDEYAAQMLAARDTQC